jgi:hypothetical protein
MAGTLVDGIEIVPPVTSSFALIDRIHEARIVEAVLWVLIPVQKEA